MNSRCKLWGVHKFSARAADGTSIQRIGPPLRSRPPNRGQSLEELSENDAVYF